MTPKPYIDVLCDRLNLLGAGDSLQVNGGTVVTAGGNWTITDNAVATLQAGYTNAWTAPNTTVTVIEGGLRFTAGNGVLPTVKVNGAAATDGFSDWALLDAHPSPTIRPVAIQDFVRTRAYACNGTHGARFAFAAIRLAAWAPDYTVRIVPSGVGTDSDVAADQTRDRRKYFQHDREDWDPTNVNDDAHAPGREDYSVLLPDGGMALGSGVALGLHQESVHHEDLQERGLWVQLEIANTSGRVEVITTAMESQKGEVLGGVSPN